MDTQLAENLQDVWNRVAATNLSEAVEIEQSHRDNMKWIS